jgi:hypothetical protein
MSRRRTLLLFAFAFAGVAHADKARVPAPALPAAQYPLHDTHEKEKVTIAAEPGDTDATNPKTRLDYAHHGFMPVRVIVTNDADTAISLDEARIHFITADGVVIPAATDDDLERRMFSRKSAAGTRIPLPAPLPSPTIHHQPVDKTILADDTDFGFKTTTVAPHTTQAGYLYYDIRDVDDPVLAHATLQVRKVQWADTKKDLFGFEIALQPTAEKKDAAKPAAKDADTTKKPEAKQ